MSNLTKDELQALTSSINDRLAEFDGLLSPLSAGIVRLLYDHMVEWQRQGLTPHIIKVERRSQPPKESPTAITQNEVEIASPPALAMANGPIPIGHRAPQPGMNVTRWDVIAKLKEMAMGGTQMPTMTQWDESKPATYPAAAAVAKRFDKGWAGIAEEAGLHLKRQISGAGQT